MTRLSLGVLLWGQSVAYPEMRAAAQRADALGYDHLWAWDHLYAVYGDPYQPALEGWSLLNAWAEATERVRLGLLVGANTFRNPTLVAKLATTLDHISGGRAILGLGGAWFELEHRAYGIDFGSGDGERLDRLDEAVGIVRRVLDGETVTHAGRFYRADGLVGSPLPIQPRLPILIGGGGEKKTLRTVARYADISHQFGDPGTLRRKDAVLRAHCADVGRDEREIERSVGCKMVIRDSEAEARRAWAELMRHNHTPEAEWEGPDVVWLGTPATIAETIRRCVDAGFATVTIELPAPYDVETMERLIGEVRPMVEASTPS